MTPQIDGWLWIAVSFVLCYAFATLWGLALAHMASRRERHMSDILRARLRALTPEEDLAELAEERRKFLAVIGATSRDRHL